MSLNFLKGQVVLSPEIEQFTLFPELHRDFSVVEVLTAFQFIQNLSLVSNTRMCSSPVMSVFIAQTIQNITYVFFEKRSNHTLD